jgi:hypothetical protein
MGKTAPITSAPHVDDQPKSDNDLLLGIVDLHNQGLSLIPVRDKDEVTPNGVIKPAKTPFKGWKAYQSERLSMLALQQEMNKWGTTAIAIICGAISENAEILDLDSKYKPGIDVTVFLAIKTFFPELFKRLRIHRTPSGGFQIPYKVKGGIIPGNSKLAGYMEEGKTQPTYFLETRGEGGYGLAPPSPGYSVHQDNPIPVITWQERCSLIALCESYNEIVKVEKKPSTRTNKESIYSENPWEHFAASDEAEKVLTNNGWKFFGEINTYIYFTRPGKETGISASFHKERRIYYFFSSSTAFEPQKGYYPGSVLSILEHRGNNKECFYRLVKDGYGKIKPQTEQKIVEKAARNNTPLQGNISDRGRELYEQTKAQLKEAHPFGIFWEMNEKGILQINRAKLYEVAEALGFRQHLGQLVRIVDFKVLRQEEKDWFNALKGYIREEDAEESYRIHHTYETFLQKAGAFSINRMRELDESLIMASTKATSYKFYQNGFLKITADGVALNPYSEIGGNLVWDSSILQRDFSFLDEKVYSRSLPFQFYDNAIGVGPHLMQVLGFLSHEYKDEAMGYIPIMVEACQNPKDGGGAGKNVFALLLRLTTTLKSMPGTQVDWSDKILSSWNMEKVFSISDAPKGTDISFLKDLSTGEGSWKKLYKDPVTVPCRLMPKFLISTNFSFSVTDGGLKRRLIPIEFTDYYTTRGGVDVVHGKMFPNDWGKEDYLAYDNIIVKGIQSFLQNGCKLNSPPLSRTGWVKQFDQTHGEMTRIFIQEHWHQWTMAVTVPTAEFNRQYEDFCEANNITKHHRKSAVRLQDAVQDWAKKEGTEFWPNEPRRILPENKTVRCKLFM